MRLAAVLQRLSPICYLFTGLIAPAALPDLMVYGPSARPYIDFITFAPNSCEVGEGCVVAGTRRLLHFEMESRNIGTADLIFGDPARNPLFVWDNCHGHYHFGQFAEYRLLTTSGTEVVTGRKIGFCLEDTIKWDPNAGPQRYNCGYQGIQRGWADRYTYDVPCQFIDITGVPAGNYILEMRVDPNNLIGELDENNNVAQVSVTIPPGCTPEIANDNMAAAELIPAAPVLIFGNNACATKEVGEPNHAGDYGGHSVWYRWTPTKTKPTIITTEGSSFDTLLAVYRLVNGNPVLVKDNDDIVNQVIRVSQVTIPAEAGVQYHIAIDGWGGENGAYRLNVDAPPNDHFTNCFAVTGLTGSTNGWNIGASREPNEPTHATTFGRRSVWYCWSAPRNGVVVWDTLGSDFDTTLAIYTGNSVNALTEVASDNDSGLNGTSVARFSASASTIYHVVVDGRGTAMGNIKLNWHYPVARMFARRQTPSQVVVTLAGEDGQYQVQSSGDLRTWANINVVTIAGGTGSFTVNVAPGPRFYRAFLVQSPTPPPI